MSANLKPLNEQVILITGASSGIGLATAKMAAKEGAKVVLVSRTDEALSNHVNQIKEAGGDAVHAVADVADVDQLRAAAEIAVKKFGRIDTWVNNAGVGMFGKITEVDPADDRRLFETNFWGIVNGSRLAVEYLKSSGGALVNVGSVVSDVSVPLQGMYSASKHAVLGFTDALRIEIEEAELPISVTTIKPAAINTPFPTHAKNYMAEEPSLPPPVYDPELVADAILFAATTSQRDVYVGGGGRLLSSVGRHTPRLYDWMMKKAGFAQSKSPRSAQAHGDSLHESNPSTAGDVHGDLEATGERMVRKHSLYGAVQKHPYLFAAGAVVLGAAVYCALTAEEHEESLKDRAKDAFDRAKSRAQDVYEYARDGASDFAGKARDTAGDLADKARHQFDGFGGRASEFAHDARDKVASAAGSARHSGGDLMDSVHDVLNKAKDTLREKLANWRG